MEGQVLSLAYSPTAFLRWLKALAICRRVAPAASNPWTSRSMETVARAIRGREVSKVRGLSEGARHDRCHV
jgi:hypothetical protein